MDRPIRVLIVDDSAFMRKVIMHTLAASPDIEVIDKAFNGVFAFKKLEKNNIDVITLDLEMPDMDGIAFLKERQKKGIDIPVVIFSSIALRGAKITMEALALGASDFILKPAGTDSQELVVMGEELVKQVIYFGRRYQILKYRRGEVGEKKDNIKTSINEVEKEKFVLNKPVPETSQYINTTELNVPPPEKVFPIRSPGKIEVVVIGISTGGPNALRYMFKEFPASFPVPVLVVQHMPAGFTKEFALSLSKICPLEVKEAEEGDIIRQGRILIAPGDKHLLVEGKPLAKIAKLTTGEPVNGHKPSVGALFLTVADIYKNNSLAVIMTGMGKDGAKEIGEIYRQGSVTLAQDKDSCVVFGMPKAAVSAGVIHRVVPLERMTQTIIELTSTHYYIND